MIRICGAFFALAYCLASNTADANNYPNVCEPNKFSKQEKFSANKNETVWIITKKLDNRMDGYVDGALHFSAGVPPGPHEQKFSVAKYLSKPTTTLELKGWNEAMPRSNPWGFTWVIQSVNPYGVVTFERQYSVGCPHHQNGGLWMMDSWKMEIGWVD
jgi:hypothetical protein